MQRRPRSKPKIVIATNGTRGAVEAYAALGLKLKTLSDCQVTIFSNPDHESLVLYMGLNFASNGVEARKEYGREMESVLQNSKGHLGRVLYLAYVNQINLKYQKSIIERLVVLLRTQKPDTCIMGQQHFWDALWVPHSLGVPCLILAMSPCAYGFCPFFYQEIDNQDEWKWSKSMIDWLLLDSYVKNIRKAIGEPTLRALGADQLFVRDANDLMHIFSGKFNDFLRLGIMADKALHLPHTCYLLGPPPYTPSAIRGGAQCFGEDAITLAQLDKFIQASKDGPLIYIGWGSMVWAHPARMTQLAVEALLLAGCRGIILSGWANLCADLLQDTDLRKFCQEHIFFAPSLPHASLFPKCNVIVHHGGTGTAYTAFRAGIPSVITPLLHEHSLMANTVNRLRIGVGTEHLLSITPNMLSEAITACLGIGNGTSLLYNCKRLAADLHPHSSSNSKKDASISLVLDTIRAADEHHGGTYWSNYRSWVQNEQTERSTTADKRSCFFFCSSNST